jgi:predicted ArsR family transcriptional regulator
MLFELLELLKDGGTHRVADLAQRLDTTPQMVEMMLADLTRMGYLKTTDAACAGTCSTCEMAGLCRAEASGNVWVLTEKAQTI